MRILAPALLLLAVPAHAADLATIDCVAGKVSAATTAKLHADVSRNMAESGKRPNYDPAVGGGIASAAALDHQRRHDSPIRRSSACSIRSPSRRTTAR